MSDSLVAVPGEKDAGCAHLRSKWWNAQLRYFTLKFTELLNVRGISLFNEGPVLLAAGYFTGLKHDRHHKINIKPKTVIHW
ncbi:TPA: hypothetical protein ACSTJZ_001978 [Serratia fonticola]|jgi:hypothetical protein|uniref:hypothetical protein n=1 Tax=Serratia fonticola TaxID=47917 RepID=UPI000FA32432|nr:hypothetical protein [Serratia fonticola]